ncbi:MAG TPA: RNase adapter RapZ [Terriglobia bacterium]|nr:RNase adapter RapZ [Terriglobia bacterium]
MKTKTKRRHPSNATRRLVVITGLSGSGKGSALKAFEDLGYYCVDNLPVGLIPRFADMCAAHASRIRRSAVVVDIREGESLSQLPVAYQRLGRDGLNVALLFLEASDEALIHRFEETRRPHPLGRNLPVREGIRLERSLLKPMRRLADTVIDTSRMNVHELRQLIQDRFGGRRRKTMLISVLSFGFKHGVPHDADLVFDVRFLPNPNFVTGLREKSGIDPEVREYVESQALTREFISRVSDLLLFLLPNYVREGKSYLTIAIGCTGGRHRSVAVAEHIGDFLDEEGFKTKIIHRDLQRNHTD